MEAAVRNFLEATEHDIRRTAEEVLFGQMRDVVASLTIEDINNSREKFADAVTKHVSNALAAAHSC